MFNFSKKRKNFSSGYGGHHHDAHKERMKKNKIMALKSFFGKFLLLSVFCVSVYFFLFSSVLSVEKITIRGNKMIGEDAVREIANNITSRKKFKIFNNNVLLLNASDISEAIKKQFNNINSVSVIKKFPRDLEISIVEKPTDIAWCNRIKIEKVTSGETNSAETAPMETAQCYFSDENNIIYEKISGEPQADSIKVFRDDQINIGAEIVNGQTADFIRNLAANFTRITGIEADYFFLPPISSRELHLATKDGWKIYFDLNRKSDDQLWVLNNVLKSKISDSEKQHLDYIDLRVIDRVNYKTK